MTYWKQQIAHATDIAHVAHQGQTRRDNVTMYVTHPLRVAKSLKDAGYGEVHQAAAMLHDVIEDTDMTAEQLLAKGIDSAIVEAVVDVTKTKGQDYTEYLEGIKANQISTAVKIADIMDNITDNPTDKQKEKYTKAILFLTTNIQGRY